MNKKLMAALSLWFAALGSNCNTGDSENPQENMLLLAALLGNQGGRLASHLNVDLASSRGLVVAGANAAAFSEGSPLLSGARVLYNLNTSNDLEVVQVFEGAAGAAPDELFDLPDYVALNYRSSHPSCKIVVARKQDNALFCAHTPWPGGYGYLYANGLAQPRQDAAGNLYIVASIGAVGTGQASLPVMWRLSPGSSGMTRTRWVDPVDLGDTNMGGFAVNPANGAVLFSLFNGSARIKNAAGGLTGVSSGSMPAVWFAPNDNFYAFSIDGLYTNREVNGLSFAASDSIGIVSLGGGWVNNRTICSTSQNTYVVMQSNLLYQLTDAAGFANNAFPLAGAQQIDQLRCSDASVFVLARNNVGDSLLARFDVAGGNFTTLLPAGDYVVSSFDVSLAGEITFGGVRNADGARVLATIPAAGGAPQLTSISTPDVSDLIRLN
jgi:hypothetical protein